MLALSDVFSEHFSLISDSVDLEAIVVEEGVAVVVEVADGSNCNVVLKELT